MLPEAKLHDIMQDFGVRKALFKKYVDTVSRMVIKEKALKKKNLSNSDDSDSSESEEAVKPEKVEKSMMVTFKKAILAKFS